MSYTDKGERDNGTVICPRYYPPPIFSESRDRDDSLSEHLVFMKRHDDGEFDVHVGKNYIRRFTLDTMPDRLKQSVAMVHAFDWPTILAGRRYMPLYFKEYYPEEAKEIGWMTGPGEYALVIEKSLLDELRGNAP